VIGEDGGGGAATARIGQLTRVVRAERSAKARIQMNLMEKITRDQLVITIRRQCQKGIIQSKQMI